MDFVKAKIARMLVDEVLLSRFKSRYNIHH
jgi:hypothetical protein